MYVYIGINLIQIYVKNTKEKKNGMKKIIVKAAIAVGIILLMAKNGEVGFWFGILSTFLLYSIISWFGMIYGKLYGFGRILRCIISLVGSVLVITGPMMILETVLPDNWFRTLLTALVTIIMFIIPFVWDWREYKSEI